MISTGHFDRFANAFPTALLPTLFSTVLDEWPNASRPTGKPLENRITHRFVDRLQMVKDMRRLPFRIEFRSKVVTPNSDSESGELDMKITSSSFDEDAYFAFECKRLNVNYGSGFKSEASEYVGDEGMGCFISGQYPATCDCGGMLGYVMDGNVESATVAVNRALKSRRKKLKLQSPFKLAQAAIMPHEIRVQQTTHKSGKFLIYHILLSFTPESSESPPPLPHPPVSDSGRRRSS